MRILSDKQIKWAYKKWCEGYTQQQVADALFVHKNTIIRMFEDKPRIRPTLKYDEREVE